MRQLGGELTPTGRLTDNPRYQDYRMTTSLHRASDTRSCHRRWSRGAFLRDVRNSIAIYDAERKRIRSERHRLRKEVRGLRRSVASAKRLGCDGAAAYFEEQIVELQRLISTYNQAIPQSDEHGRRAIAQMLAVVRRVAPWACQSERQRQRLPGRPSRSRSSHRAVARVARPAARSTADPDGESHGSRPRLSSEVRS